MIPGCWPGGTVCAGGANTGGVNRLPPVGLMLFSVGDIGALLGGAMDGVVVVVVVVVVVLDGALVLDGAGLPLLPHAAVNAPSPMSTTPPTRAIQSRG